MSDTNPELQDKNCPVHQRKRIVDVQASILEHIENVGAADLNELRTCVPCHWQHEMDLAAVGLMLGNTVLITTRQNEEKKQMATKKTGSKKSKKQAKRLMNRIALVFDKSYSMFNIKDAAQDAINRLIGEVKAQAASSKQTTMVDLFWFGQNISVGFGNVDASMLPIHTAYNPTEGATRLLDAVKKAIHTLDSRHNSDNDDVSYLVYVITDGQENSSRDITAKDLAALIADVQGTDRWTVAFQGPRGSKAYIENLGIPSGNVTEWDQTAAGVQHAVVNQTGAGLGVFYNARTLGQTSTCSFYTTDLSKVTSADLKKLADVSGKVKFLKVEAEEQIRDFVERKTGKPYVKGSAFYALTKDEDEVQEYKRILIAEKVSRNKKRKRVFAGAEARRLLGLPETGTVKVRPGNHSDYDVYIESTSVNRKLVRGTKVAVVDGSI